MYANFTYSEVDGCVEFSDNAKIHTGRILLPGHTFTENQYWASLPYAKHCQQILWKMN